MADHELFFARVVEVGAGRLREPPLLYSSRLGWRITGEGLASRAAASATSCSRAGRAGFDAGRRAPTSDEAVSDRARVCGTCTERQYRCRP